MLKKKNIAMVMAAATVATSVAPVFAATKVEQVDEATLISEVEKYLGVKYSDSKETGNTDVITSGNEYKNSVYQIVNDDNQHQQDIKNVDQVKALIADAKAAGTGINLTVIDKGHKEVNGKIVAEENNKYTKYVSDFGNEFDGLKTSNIATEVNKAADNKSVEIVLASGAVLDLTVDSYKLDLTTGLDAQGKEITIKSDMDAATINKIVDFKLDDSATASVKDLPSKAVTKLAYNSANVNLEVNMSELETEDGFTKKGADLINTLVNANNATTPAKTTTVVKDGNSYTIVYDKDNTTEVVFKDGSYQMDIIFTSKQGTKPTKNVKITVKSDVQADLVKLKKLVEESANVTQFMGKYSVLAGDDRFETAVAISNAGFVGKSESPVPAKNKINADAIVLVGKDAIVDGLAAAPLAKQKNAPILLTEKDTVPTQTMTEMKRILKNEESKTIYVVGGENTISEDAVAQLIKELGRVEIVRLAGDDRYETSLEIADAMNKTTMTDVFVVGGYGEADAMSIAAVAANKTTNATTAAPIIVTPESGLTKQARTFFATNKNGITNVDVIGGTSKVSSQVLKDINNADESTVAERVSGADRQETNAKVINKYYPNNVDGVYVAKDGYVGGNSQLIDALAVAPLAGRTNTPVVLGTNDLTIEQVEAIEDNAKAVSGLTKHTMTQVGEGIVETVLEKIMKILSL